MLINDATEPGVHILANASGSSLKLVNKDGRQRVFTPWPGAKVTEYTDRGAL